MGVFITSGDAIQIVGDVDEFKLNTNNDTLHLPTHSGKHESLCGVMGVEEADSYESVSARGVSDLQDRLCKNCYCYWRGEFPDPNRV